MSLGGRLAAVAGAFLVGVAALELVVLECFLLPLRWGTIPIPLSVLLAVGGNIGLPRLAGRASGSRFAMGLPLLIWAVVVVRLSIPRTEGDLIVTGSGWNLVFLLAGVSAAAYALGRLLVGPPRRAPRAGAAARSGSGDGR